MRMCKHLRFWFTALALLSVVPALAANRLALVIGNDAYQKVEPLKNARNDARLMASVLRKAGFEVTQANDLGRDALWGAVDSFRGRIQKGDEVVFYFAGHGVQIGGNQLLLPTDIVARNDGQVQRDGIPLIDIQDALKDARVAVLLVDACRDNPFPKQGTRNIGETRGLLPPEPSTGQIIMLSAGRNQRALDRVPGTAQANGLFTWELAQVLQTPGLEIRTALEQVKDRVDDKARRADHQQRPSLVSDLRGSFYLITGPGVQVASVKPEPVPTIRQPGQGGGVSLEDLEKEEATRKQWALWQARMKADFDRTAAFAGSADLQAKAWERFLGLWTEDNPQSREDEELRAQALSRRDQVLRQTASQTAATQPQPVTPPQLGTIQPGTVFSDCPECPQMVLIPAGRFLMGSPAGEPERSSDEGPQHEVQVSSFAAGKTEVTFGQWDACVAAEGCDHKPGDPGWGRGERPVINVSWEDAQQYVKWLSGKTGKGYRLLSEAEWEYAARAGATTAFHTGATIMTAQADFNGNYTYNGSFRGEYRRRTVEVGSFAANAFGLHDMHGNVWEWVQDVWHDNYSGAPADGSAWMEGGEQVRRVLRGGSWRNSPGGLRSASRSSYTRDFRDDGTGFRVARTL